MRVTIIACVICFLAGIIFSCFFRKGASWFGWVKTCLSQIGTMNLILVILGISIYLFIMKMIQMFELYGTIPDTLVTCFFAVVGGECGVMGWIRTTKENNKMRKWQLEDQTHEEEKQKAKTKEER